MDREMSYMCAIVKDAEELREVGKMLEWLSNAPGIKVLSHENTKEGITLALTVDELEYEAQIYPVKPEIPQMYRTQHLFPDVDLEALDKAQAGLAVDMEFGEDALKSYHAQLRVINALVPNAVALLDHSAEKLLSGRWVSLAAASKVHPAPRYIYIVQAVSGQNEFEHIWFELLDMKEDGLYCKLTQEPYYVKDMHEGSTETYSFDRVTDWLIYTKERRISPDEVYLLDY